MSKIFQSRKSWAIFLLVLLLANLFIYWPRNRRPESFPGRHALALTEIGARPVPSAEMSQAGLQKLPEAQRKAAQERMADDLAFFDTIKNLPEEERHEKMLERFKKNPPLQIPGLGSMEGTPPGSGGPGGGTGGPESGHIPDPQVRHSMDQHIVDSQRKGGGQ